MGFWTILAKDLRLEIRTKESLATMVIFSASVILLFAFAFDAAPAQLRIFTPGLLWLTYFFTAVLGLIRIFGRESEFDAYDLLLTAPVDRSSIFLGKMVAFFLLLLLAQLISLPLFILFLELPIRQSPLALIFIIALTDLAIAPAGTLIAGLSHRTPAGATLLPILLFPVLTPILIAATKATDAILSGKPFVEWDLWFMILITFFTLFVLAGTFIFDYISEE